jgi:penicillin-binding protein 1C
MVMQAASRSSETILYWDLDGQYLGLTERVHELTVTPAPGKHILTVTDNNGSIIKKNFEILEQ